MLTYTNGAGLTFTRQIDVDADYMFTLTDTVANAGALPVTIAPYGSVQRQGVPPDPGKSSVVHEGSIGYLDGKERAFTYKDLTKNNGAAQEFNSTAAWTGITDMYWLAALIPPASEQVHAVFRDAKAGGVDVYEANYTGAARHRRARWPDHHDPAPVRRRQDRAAAAGLRAEAGYRPLRQRHRLGPLLLPGDPADVLVFLTFIYHQVGTFGVAILLLTVCVRVAFFPIANKQYESMTKMKKVQPMMEDLRKRFKDDPAKQQQEIMALYQREKVNPLAGCLPILLQIPVFYSLYKVLNISIEMRHAPFLNYSDLSARDPTTIWNLFGLIPWNPAHLPLAGPILDTTPHLGILPLCYGFTMWLSTSMSPQTGIDPAQQRMFQLMPLIFMFIMAPFAVGLLIYWTWSNCLTTLQQYVMMRRFGVGQPDRPDHRPADRQEARRGMSETFTEEELEAARVLFAHEVTFMMGAVQIAGLPPADLPEVAFAGRSNVGKSTLINAVAGRLHLARASNSPGRTREVNFFVADEKLRLVDLPGYGFARASKGDVKKFQNLGRAYLRGRPNLMRAYLLIDSRHGLKDVDTEALWTAFDIAARSPARSCLTKADKPKAGEIEAVVARTLKAIAERPAAFPRVLATSAEKGAGIPELRAEIVAACLPLPLP